MPVIFHIDKDKAMGLLTEPQAVAAVSAAAEACVGYAKDIQPELSGESSAAIGMFGTEVIDGVAAAIFGSSSPIWHLMEFGSANNPPFRPLTSAVERAGLTFTPTSGGTTL